MPSQQNCSENKRIVEGEEQRSKIQAAFGSGKLDVTIGDMTSGCEEPYQNHWSQPIAEVWHFCLDSKAGSL